MQVDKNVRALTKRARWDGQFCTDGVADAERFHQRCLSISSLCSSTNFLNSRGELVHYSSISRADVAAMSAEEYQRFASLAPQLFGHATMFLPEPGALMFGMNAAGQFLSGSFANVTESEF